MESTEVTETVESGPPSESGAKPAAGPASEAKAEATSEAAADPAPGAEPVVAPPRRVGRTVALIAVAAVLGIVAGTAVGYGIQAQRPPTALPALNQRDLAYPAKPLPKGKEPEPLSAAEDRGLKTEGDLRDLMLPKPKGARLSGRVPKDNRLSVTSYAADYDNPGSALSYLLGNDVRRVVATSWSTGMFKSTTIDLVQFRPGDREFAAEHAEDQRSYLAEEAGATVGTIKGSRDGRTYVMPAERRPGYLDFYMARAVFHRGDVMVDIVVTDTKKISQKEITSLAERQLERL
ncbi:hypothetical protein ACFVQ4_14700 [Streptomyces laurentii]|uniref:hypothetical protein n=1 Tax=Streptomyces laurentii TaxID=39478 RepID=UPI0036BE2F2A